MLNKKGLDLTSEKFNIRNLTVPFKRKWLRFYLSTKLAWNFTIFRKKVAKSINQ